MFHFVWGFLFVGDFCREFLGFLLRGNFWRGFLAEVFWGFWDFWRLGIFGVFVGLVVLRVESVLERRCCDIDVGTLIILALLVVWFGIGFEHWVWFGHSMT
jgi:hypothetical protein